MNETLKLGSNDSSSNNNDSSSNTNNSITNNNIINSISGRWVGRDIISRLTTSFFRTPWSRPLTTMYLLLHAALAGMLLLRCVLQSTLLL